MSDDTNDDDLLSWLNSLEEPDLDGIEEPDLSDLNTTITMEHITALENVISMGRSASRLMSHSKLKKPRPKSALEEVIFMIRAARRAELMEARLKSAEEFIDRQKRELLKV